MKHFDCKTTPQNFKKWSKGKKIYVNWVYSKHDAGLLEVSKIEFFNQCTLLKAMLVSYNVTDNGNFIINELIF